MKTSKIPFHSLDISASRSSSFDEEERASESTLLFPYTKPRHRCVAAIPYLLVFTLAIWGLLSILVNITHHFDPRKPNFDSYQPATLPKDYNLCDCGSTITEARSKGCKFDTMAAAWLPKYCRDEELTAVFERSGTETDGSWPYYADANGTQRVSIDEIAALGKASIYATRYWHVSHCLFYWAKYVRMRKTGAVMEARFD